MSRIGVIAFDLDGTFWRKEIQNGSRIVAPAIPPDIYLLIQLLEAGFVVAVCSGNAAEHVIRVLAKPLLKALYDRGRLGLAKGFYAFFQLGGGLARFQPEALLAAQNAGHWRQAKKRLFSPDGVAFHTDHVDSEYVNEQSIAMKQHGPMLRQLIKDALGEYERICSRERRHYRSGDRVYENPEPQLRKIKLKGRNRFKAVQYTLKPLYSENQCTKSAQNRGLGYEANVRYQVAKFVNDRLKREGGELTATAAGTSSIDITNHDLSKKTALEYLRKQLREHTQNMLYFGDELHLGGNDVVVPLDLKITSFSVGPDAIFHPCVFAAPKLGPEGTFAVLHSLLGFAAHHRGENSAVDAFRGEHSRQIVVQKLGSLSAEALQTLALVATAGARDRDLNDLHELIAAHVRALHADLRPPGAGASHWTGGL